MKTLRCLALSAALAGSPSTMSAPAAAAGDTLSQRIVKFGDLDLRQSRGVEVLYLRIRTAAHEVCESYSSLQLKSVSLSRECAQNSIARAIIAVNMPKLTAYYREKLGVSAEKPSRLAETAGASRD